MLIDKMNEFADAASAVVGLGLTVVIGDVIDLGATPVLRDIGNGEQIYLVIQVDTTVVGANSTTQFKLVSDSTDNLTTSPTTHFATAAIPVATLVAGYTVCQVALPNGVNYERYLGVTATNATAATTAGKVNAFLTNNPANWAAYSDQF
jgi:hypothetical protein